MHRVHKILLLSDSHKKYILFMPKISSYQGNTDFLA